MHSLRMAMIKKTELLKKIEEIKVMLTRMDDEELILDLHSQMIAGFKQFLEIQNKSAKVMIYDVENFFDGVKDVEELEDKIKEAKNKKPNK